MFTFQNIYKAYLQCRQHKRTTHNALKFEHNLVENLWELTHALQQRTYRPGRSICFLARSPKLREVFAADFRDRIVHHLLVGALEPMYERKFIYDVYNNRRGKGTHAAVARARTFMQATGGEGGYYLQLDIRGFFYHLDREVLLGILREDVMRAQLEHADEILYLAETIIRHDPTRAYHFQGDIRSLRALPPHKSLFKLPPHKGLPIGNLTSQFFANVYLNRFDHFVKRVLKGRYYLRYVDDFVLFDTDVGRLKWLHEQIAHYLKRELGLMLRPDFRLRRHRDGLDFLGYVIRPHYTLVRHRVVRNFKRKKARYLERYEQLKGQMGLEEIRGFLSVRASFAAHIKHANSYNLNLKVGVLHETNPFDYDRA